jgi:hypothetical protein
MTWDPDAAVRFVATNGRLLDARRLDHLVGDGTADAVVAALDAYRNADGGYGWSLEPDLRSVTSQPVAAMHALEVLAEVRDGSDRAARLCDWLGDHTLPGGGVPFALPYADAAGSAPHWPAADPHAPSLMMTAQLAAQAHRLPSVAGHPWLAAATAYCLDALEAADEAPPAMELMFVLRFLDAAAVREPRAQALIDRLVVHVDTERPIPVAGGAVGEVLQLVEFTPYPDGWSRTAFGADAVAAALDRLGDQQQDDGGWQVSYATFSPAAALEWRGYATVQAVSMLRGTKL